MDHELSVLESIYEDSSRNEKAVRQRELSANTGIALGMTNAIIKRMAQNGWLTIRKLNSRTIHYAVTTKGIEELTSRVYRYVSRTIKNVAWYNRTLEALLDNVRDSGYSEVALVGASDHDFLIEHTCLKKNMRFRLSSDRQPEHSQFVVFSEDTKAPRGGARGDGFVFLRDILVGL